MRVFQEIQTEMMACHSQQPISDQNATVEQAVVWSLFLLIGYFFSKRLSTDLSFSKPSDTRWDILSVAWIKSAIKWKYFSFSLRLIPALLFIFVLLTGLFGRKYTSLAAGFTWLFWWTVLIFFVAFAGKIFCAICPWDFFANVFQYGTVHKRRKKAQSLNLRFPKVLSNVYLAVFLFILLTWLELGFDITRNSYTTALLGLGLFGMAVLSAFLFEKRTFCRYACPVGRISGLYAQLSPIELRRKKPEICATCKTKECVRGSERSLPCPTKQIPFKLDQNTYCTLCTECIRSCNKDNLTLKLRPIAVDVNSPKTSRKDESILALVMFVLTFFHGLTMTQPWFTLTEEISLSFHFTYTQSFTILMLILLVSTMLLFALIDRIIVLVSGRSGIGMQLAYILIPITLGYHLGHNAMHLFGESLYMVPLLNDPFGYGWNLLGFSNFKPYPLMDMNILRFLQITVITLGFYYSVRTLRNRIEKISDHLITRRILYAGYFLLLCLIGYTALWFVYQPMVMKSAGM